MKMPVGGGGQHGLDDGEIGQSLEWGVAVRGAFRYGRTKGG